jgi:hypothetical protein
MQAIKKYKKIQYFESILSWQERERASCETQLTFKLNFKFCHPICNNLRSFFLFQKKEEDFVGKEK